MHVFINLCAPREHSKSQNETAKFFPKIIRFDIFVLVLLFLYGDSNELSCFKNFTSSHLQNGDYISANVYPEHSGVHPPRDNIHFLKNNF